jgi:hypothetical protein
MTIIISKADQTSSVRHFWLMVTTMHHKVAICLMTVLTLALLPLSASAAVITFTSSFLGGNQWQYNYTVAADSGGPSIDEFTIYFDPSTFANLAATASPQGWDPLVIQPDTAIPADGYFDSLALISGISPGTSLGGFSVSFDFLGLGTPGYQRFDIVDPNSFETLSTGFTSVAPVISAVPEPNILTLMSLGLAFLLIFRSRISKT